MNTQQLEAQMQQVLRKYEEESAARLAALSAEQAQERRAQLITKNLVGVYGQFALSHFTCGEDGAALAAFRAHQAFETDKCGTRGCADIYAALQTEDEKAAFALFAMAFGRIYSSFYMPAKASAAECRRCNDVDGTFEAEVKLAAAERVLKEWLELWERGGVAEIASREPFSQLGRNE